METLFFSKEGVYHVGVLVLILQEPMLLMAGHCALALFKYGQVNMCHGNKNKYFQCKYALSTLLIALQRIPYLILFTVC